MKHQRAHVFRQRRDMIAPLGSQRLSDRGLVQDIRPEILLEWRSKI
jgi:hypothetical protein